MYTRLYFYSVLLPYETATFQLKSPEKQKIGLHSPDLHKMLIRPQGQKIMYKALINKEVCRKHPGFVKDKLT